MEAALIIGFASLAYLLHQSVVVFAIDCLLLWASVTLAVTARQAGQKFLSWVIALSFVVPVSLLYVYAAVTGQYVNIDLLLFAGSNLFQLVLHLLQQGQWPVTLILALWLSLCLIFADTVTKVPTSVGLRGCLISIGLAVTLGSLAGHEHPLWALWPQHHRANLEPDMSDWVERAPSVAPSEGRQPSFPIIVIYVESLRNSLLGLEPSPMPHLKSVVTESGYYFARSYAAATSSHFSNPAFWFSQYPLRSARFRAIAASDPGPRQSIFDSVKPFGYQTAYISSQNENWGKMISWMKSPSVDFFFHSEDFKGETHFDLDDRWGLRRMLEQGVIRSGKVADDETLRIASEWISRQDKTFPFALGITLQNTHHSYYIPQGGPEPFQPASLDFPAVFGHWPEEKKEQVYNRYLNAVYNVDLEIAEFFETLKQRDLWDSSLVLVTGDGGEAFYEHGYANHAGPLYDEAIRSFTWLKPPAAVGGVEAEVVEKAISHIDLVPSILDLLGLPIPHEHQGVSFQSDEIRPVYLYANGFIEQDGIIEWPWKLLVTYNRLGARPELYNLELDPSERENVAERNAQETERLRAMLDRWRATQLAYYSNAALYERYFPPKYLPNSRHESSEPAAPSN